MAPGFRWVPENPEWKRVKKYYVNYRIPLKEKNLHIIKVSEGERGRKTESLFKEVMVWRDFGTQMHEGNWSSQNDKTV